MMKQSVGFCIVLSFLVACSQVTEPNPPGYIGIDRIEVGMSRELLISTIGRPIFYDPSEDLVACDSFIYEQSSDARFLHVWYSEDGVSEFSDGHEGVCGFFSPEVEMPALRVGT